MSMTVYIAQGFAIYMLTVGIAVMFNRRNFQLCVHDLMSSPGSAYLSAILTLILGIILVLLHNVWVRDWPVVVTLLAWATLLKGALRVVYPQVDETFLAWMESDSMYTFAGAYALFLGAALALMSYTVLS